MAKGDDIQERLIDFAVRITRVCDALPRSRAGRHFADQLLRSGTAPAAHYSEARGAESLNDFVHKLKICLKELNESSVWLAVITKSGMLSASQLGMITSECHQLARIVNSSIHTARGNDTTVSSTNERSTAQSPADLSVGDCSSSLIDN